MGLDKFNKIIVCDLAPDFMAEEFELIKDRQVLYTDHHLRDKPIPKEILELVTVDKGYFPSSRTAGELTKLKPWLSLIGTVTDCGDFYPEDQKFIEDRLGETSMTLDEFKENVTSVITNFLVYFDNDTDKAFEILKDINSLKDIKKLRQYSEPVEKEVQKFIEEYELKKEKLGDINFYYFEPHFPVRVPVVGIISQRDDEAYIFASLKNDKKYISLSGRNTSKKRNMSKVLKAGVEGLKESGAGGHEAAAGGQIQTKDLEKFKENIRKFIE